MMTGNKLSGLFILIVSYGWLTCEGYPDGAKTSIQSKVLNETNNGTDSALTLTELEDTIPANNSQINLTRASRSPCDEKKCEQGCEKCNCEKCGCTKNCLQSPLKKLFAVLGKKDDFDIKSIFNIFGNKKEKDSKYQFDFGKKDGFDLISLITNRANDGVQRDPLPDGSMSYKLMPQPFNPNGKVVIPGETNISKPVKTVQLDPKTQIVPTITPISIYKVNSSNCNCDKGDKSDKLMFPLTKIGGIFGGIVNSLQGLIQGIAGAFDSLLNSLPNKFTIGDKVTLQKDQIGGIFGKTQSKILGFLKPINDIFKPFTKSGVSRDALPNSSENYGKLKGGVLNFFSLLNPKDGKLFDGIIENFTKFFKFQPINFGLIDHLNDKKSKSSLEKLDLTVKFRILNNLHKFIKSIPMFIIHLLGGIGNSVSQMNIGCQLCSLLNKNTKQNAPKQIVIEAKTWPGQKLLDFVLGKIGKPHCKCGHCSSNCDCSRCSLLKKIF